MSISEIELKFLINNIKIAIDDIYYISTIYPITKNSLIIKFHHSQKKDISLLVSTFGICITKYQYSTIEENEAIKKIKSDLERSRLVDISIFSGERIVQFIFQNITGIKYFLIVELFGNGNIILCNESLKILAIINPINVRHRTLKPGLKYFQPPSRGIDPRSINFNEFISIVKRDNEENTNIKKWLGRNISISKKYIEFIVNNLNIENKKIQELSSTELKMLFDNIILLINNISLGAGNYEPCIILDEKGNFEEISPFIPYNINPQRIKKFSSYFEAVDVYLNYLIINSDASKYSELEKRIETLEHDIKEQEKAKDLVILKSNKLREFANLLMQQPNNIINTENNAFQKTLNDFNAKILNIKGKYFLEIAEEKIDLDVVKFSSPKLSSFLFNIEKMKV